jgi:hypothetical protein
MKQIIELGNQPQQQGAVFAWNLDAFALNYFCTCSGFIVFFFPPVPDRKSVTLVGYKKIHNDKKDDDHSRYNGMQGLGERSLLFFIFSSFPPSISILSPQQRFPSRVVHDSTTV